MSEFSFNYSVVDEKYQIILSSYLVRALRAQARVLLVPFFRKVSIQVVVSDKGKDYPALTPLAESIFQSVFEEGEIDYESVEEAANIALDFLGKLSNWQKECISFYFCSDEEFLQKMGKENELIDDENIDLTIEEMYCQDGAKIKKATNDLVQNEAMLASYLVKELIHLQDIFSAGDIDSWDAASITNANENFQEYAGKDQVLITMPHGDFDYWASILGVSEKNDEEEEEEEEEEGEE